MQFPYDSIKMLQKGSDRLWKSYFTPDSKWMEQILVDEQGNQIEPSGFLLPSAYQINNKINK